MVEVYGVRFFQEFQNLVKILFFKENQGIGQKRRRGADVFPEVTALGGHERAGPIEVVHFTRCRDNVVELGRQHNSPAGKNFVFNPEPVQPMRFSPKFFFPFPQLPGGMIVQVAEDHVQFVPIDPIQMLGYAGFNTGPPGCC